LVNEEEEKERKNGGNKRIALSKGNNTVDES